MGQMTGVTPTADHALSLLVQPAAAFVYAREALYVQGALMTTALFFQVCAGTWEQVLSAVLVRTLQAHGSYELPITGISLGDFSYDPYEAFCLYERADSDSGCENQPLCRGCPTTPLVASAELTDAFSRLLDRTV
jgi:hypothetical protein